MSTVNKAIIVGNLGADPDMRYTHDGTAVANLSVATSEKWKDKNSGEQKERTEWHRISCFGRLAEICGEYLRKGSKVYVEGQIQTRKWQDKEGSDRYTTEIKAREMRMLSPRPEGAQRGQSRQQPLDTKAAQPASEAPPDFDDDIPF